MFRHLIEIVLLFAFAFGTCVAENKQDPNLITIALTGDVMPGTTYPTVRLPANDGRDLLSQASPWLTRVDLSVGNFEGTFCGDDLNYTTKNSEHRYAFKCPPKYAKLLKDAGYDFLSLANNHIHDFGNEGMKQTAKALDDVGIAHAGDILHKKYVVVKKNGVRYGLCAFGHNFYTYKHTDTVKVKAILKELRGKCDVLIVSFHGGSEGLQARHLPYSKERFFGEDRGNLRSFAHLCIRNGADVVYGHGPHVARCVEIFQNRFIAYSLGNFCTPFGISLEEESALAPLILVRLKHDGTFVSGQIYSYKQKPGTGPKYDPEHSTTKEIKQLTEEDQKYSPVDISIWGEIRYKHK